MTDLSPVLDPIVRRRRSSLFGQSQTSRGHTCPPSLAVPHRSVTLSSGVTTDPADPAMRGGRGPMGAQNYGINFFHCKFNTAILCGRALT